MSKKYTLALLEAPQQILLINRFKKPFIGQWNGIGGKIEPGETPLDGIQREIFEETGFESRFYETQDLGRLDWHIDDEYIAPIYLFSAQFKQNFVQTARSMREGVLYPFSPNWLLNPQNQSLVPDLKAILPYMLNHEKHVYRTNFSQDQLVDFKIE